MVMIKKHSVSVTVDASKEVGIYHHDWRYVGYDECNYTYHPEGAELIQKFSELGESGPYYFRTHFLFCTGNLQHTYKWGSTNIYQEDEKGNPVYNFTTFDRILSTYLDHGAKPFVELGFMPMDLVDQKYYPKTTEDWNAYNIYRTIGSACPPKDYDKWYALVFETVKHCVEKYGKEEVLTWKWELWNEPDIFYWNGTCQEYCKLFDYTEKAVHDALPNAMLSGPASTGPYPDSPHAKFLEQFLDHCKNGVNYATGAVGTRLDFITFHVKGGAFLFDHKAKKDVPSIKKFMVQCKNGMEIIQKYGYGGLEVVLSEADPDGWAAGGIGDNPNMRFRNSEYYATYVASSYHNLHRLCKQMGMHVMPIAWAFLFVGESCFSGTRTFTTQGIDKPVFNLFKLYGKLGEREVKFYSTGETDALAYPDDFATGIAPEVNGFAVKKEDGSVQILLYSHHDDIDLPDHSCVSLEIFGVPEDASVTCWRIDRDHSNAHTLWKQMNCPDYPDKNQWNQLAEAGNLQQSKEKSCREGRKLLIETELPAHAVILFDVR